jgi:DNA topoisomerase-3
MARKFILIAEKKTLADDFSKAFKERKYSKNCIAVKDPELGEGKIFWLFGHLFETDIEETLKRNGYPEKFPVFPKKLVLKPKKERAALWKELKKELTKGDWEVLYLAGDCDREGELLGREPLEYLGLTVEELEKKGKKVLRPWFSSQVPSELRRAIIEAKPAKEYNALYEAGKARQLADFLIGINGSIALQKKSGYKRASLGRVQTPILKLIVEREKEIENFKPQQYFLVYIHCAKDGTTFRARYTGEEAVKVNKERAQELIEALKKESYATVKSVKTSRKKISPPKLYSLSDLQRDANKLYGYTAEQVLASMQVLYEGKVVSYPRTSANTIAQKDLSYVNSALKKMGERFRREFGLEVGKEQYALFAKRTVNDKKTAEAGHPAILPLAPLEEIDERFKDKVGEREKRIYDLILKRFVAQFMPPYEYDETVVALECGGLPFEAKGKVEVNLGWKAVYKGQAVQQAEENKNKEDEENKSPLPPLNKGEQVKKVKEEAVEKWTTPPPRYTDASLISVMKKYNLGTEATRSTFVPALISRGLLARKGKEIVPTEAGKIVAQQLGDLKVADVKLTAAWETFLEKIKQGKLETSKRKFSTPQEAANYFLKKTCELTQSVVKDIEQSDINPDEFKKALESVAVASRKGFKRRKYSKGRGYGRKRK